MLSSITLGLAQPQGQSAIARLFAGGEAGFDYDFTDFNRTTTWRRNVLLWSQQFDNATSWLKVAIGTGSAPVVTPNAAVAPDGTTTAALIAFNRGAGNAVSDQSYIIQTITPPSVAAPYTFSIWLKAATVGDIGKQLALRTVGGSPYGVVTLTANWVRYTRTETGSSNNGAEINTRGTVTADNAVSAHVWGAQTEPGSTATDYQRMTDFTSDFRAAFPDTLFYADTAGTTPVTAVEQTVALILDKSRPVRLGPELNGDPGLIGNGFWSVNAGVTVGSGKVVFSATPVGNALFRSTYLTAGKTYQISITVANYVAGAVGVETDAPQGALASANGTFTCNVRANSGVIYLTARNATTTLDITNISVRELPGLHQTQATPGSRAVLRSRYNQFTYSEDVSNAAWTKTGITITADAGIAPDGTTTADRMTAAAIGYYLQGNALLNGTNVPVFATIRIKNENYTVSDTLYVNVSDGITGFVQITFKPFDGTFTTPAPAASWSNVTRTVTNIGDGYWLLTLQGTTAQWGSGWMEVGVSSAHNRSCLVWGHDLRRANDAHIPYQTIRAATDYATGPQFPTYLEYDGVDDSYASAANLDLSGTDKLTVFAAVTKLSDATSSTFVEFSADAASNTGTFAFYLPGSAGFNEYYWRSRGTAVANTNALGFASPHTAVITGIGDISGDLARVRVNGAVGGTSVSDQGTGNYGNYQLFLGRQNNTGFPFRGRMYRVIGRGAATATPLITAVEQQLNGQVGRVY